MVVEFQISSAAFTAGVTEAFKAGPICAPGLYGDYAIDHVEVLDDATVVKLPLFGQTIYTPQGAAMISPAFQTAVSQPIKIIAATVDAFEAAGMSPVPPEQTLQATISIHLVLSAAVVAGTAQLSVEYGGVDLGELAGLPQAGAIEATISANAQQLVAIPQTIIDMTPVKKLVGHPVAVSNVGVGTDAGGSLIAVRLEIGGPFGHSVADWEAFYQGASLPSHLHGAAWSLFIDQESVVQAVLDRVGDGLYKAGVDGTFDQDADPAATWQPSSPGIDVTFSGAVVDACPVWMGPFYAGMIDLDLDVTLNALISVPTPNTLVLDLKFNWTTVPGQDFACAISAAQFWPAVGTILLAQGKIDAEFSGGLILETAVPFLGSASVFGLFLYGMGQAGTNLPVESFEKVDDTDADLEYVQKTENIDLGPGLTLITALGESVGLVMAGTADPPPKTTHPPKVDFIPEHPEFEWSWPDLCKENVLKATAELTCSNPEPFGFYTPLQVCSATPVDDRDGQFGPYINIFPGLYGGTVRVAVPLSGVLPSYVADPYPCKLLVQTNGGSRLVTIPPFPILSADEQAKLEVTLQIERAIKCHIWAHWFWGIHFNPQWLGDPPWEKATARHVWHIELAGSTQDGSLALADARGRAVARARVGPDGRASLTTFFDTPDRDPQVDISGEPPPALASSDIPAGALAVNQMLLFEQAELRFADRVRHLSGRRVAGRPALFCITGDSLRAFDLFRAGRPRLIAHESEHDLDGVVAEAGLTWGRAGLLRFDLDEPTFGLRPVVDQEAPVYSVARRRNLVYCLRRSTLDVLDHELRQLSSIELVGFRHLLVVGQTLLAGGREGIVTFDLSDPREPRHAGRYDVGDVVELQDAGFAGASGHSVFVRTAADLGRSLYLGERGETFELASYEERPWFVGALRVGHVIARLNEDRRRVTVYEIARSRELNRPAIEQTATRG